MKFLEKINEIYGRFLFIPIPLITCLFAIIEALTPDNKHAVGFVIAVVSVLLSYLYINGGKNSIPLCIALLYELFVVSTMFFGSLFNMSDFLWIVFIVIEIIGLVFTLSIIVIDKRR